MTSREYFNQMSGLIAPMVFHVFPCKSVSRRRDAKYTRSASVVSQLGPPRENLPGPKQPKEQLYRIHADLVGLWCPLPLSEGGRVVLALQARDGLAI